MTYIELIKEILKEASEPITAREISNRLTSKGHIGMIKSEPITPTQIRNRIREDDTGDIETIKTTPYTYRLKGNSHNLRAQKTAHIDDKALPTEETSFKNWIRHNHNQITRPEKYTDTINTISRNLEKKTGKSLSIYQISDAQEAIQLRDLYFSFKDLQDTNKRGNNMYSRSLDLYIEFLLTRHTKEDTDVNNVITDGSLSPLQKQTIILSRVGQGKYREDLIKLWDKCPISAFSDIRVLVASHIKPWRDCNNIEKIDKFNGLLLLPTYDKLFDLGLISFDNDGKILISPSLIDLKSLNLNRDIKIALKKENIKYLEYHRDVIFNE